MSRRLAAPAVLTVLAAAARFSTIPSQSFGYDESVTVVLLRRPFVEMLRQLPSTENTPPLYYVLAWGWTRVFGDGEVGLRSLSALIGTATVPVAYLAARRLVSHRAGVVVAALAAVNPFLVWYSQEARAYALLGLLSAGTLWLFARVRDKPSARRLVLWAAVSALAIATHYFAVFLVVGEAAWLVWGTRRQEALNAVAAVGVVGLALVPLLRRQESHGGVDWISMLPLRDRWSETAREFVTGGWSVPHLGAFTALLVLVAGAALLVWRGNAAEQSGALVTGTLALAALAAPMAIALAGKDYFFFRNVIGAWLPLAIVVGAGLGARRAGLVGLGAAAGVAALSIAGLVLVAARPSLQRSRGYDYRAAMEALGDPVSPRLVAVEPYWEWQPLAAYRPDAVRVAGSARVEEIDLLRSDSRQDMSTFRVPLGFSRAETRRLRHYTLVRYRSAGRREITPAFVGGSGATMFFER